MRSPDFTAASRHLDRAIASTDRETENNEALLAWARLTRLITSRRGEISPLAVELARVASETAAEETGERVFRLIQGGRK